MKIVLYSMTSDKRKIGKTKAKLFELDNVVMKDNTSVVNPTFIFNRKKTRQNEILPNYFKCNYIYSYGTKKYYFVSDIRMINGSALEFICVEDVLETYKKNILSLTTLIERQENLYVKQAEIVDIGVKGGKVEKFQQLTLRQVYREN